MRKFGPKIANHPSCGMPCPLCGVPFVEGDYTALVPVAPADLEESQKKAAGRPYNAVAKEIHVDCAVAVAEVVVADDD